MPNTLIHIAIQTPLSRSVYEKVEIPWILAGVIIPDIPWIFQRVFLGLGSVDPYQARLYFTVQASLFFCLLLSLAVSQFARYPKITFVVLAANSLLHLILDAMQYKWGNGVHLLAPLSWQYADMGFIWPESIVGYLLSFTGIIYLLWRQKTIVKEGLSLRSSPRWKIALVAALLYICSPPLFMQQLEKSDPSYITTLQEKEKRIGKYIELDRSYYSKEKQTVTTFANEKLRLSGIMPAESSPVSVKGTFVDTDHIEVKDFHQHTGYRDFASKTGLLLSALIWLALLVIPPYRRLRRTRP